MTFRSGLKFTVSTRLWINWPQDHYAFIPIVIELEVTELIGQIRFGVTRNTSFFSFVGEPYTRFNLHSEIGKQYKLKDIPKLSALLISKIKKMIRTKMVYPAAHKFRLLWPKNWWPEGAVDPGAAPKSTDSAAAASTSSNLDLFAENIASSPLSLDEKRSRTLAGAGDGDGGTFGTSTGAGGGGGGGKGSSGDSTADARSFKIILNFILYYFILGDPEYIIYI